MRYLGLDVGRRFIGVAVGQLLAAELTTLVCPKKAEFYLEPNRSVAISQLIHLLNQEEADAFVVGLPVDQEGKATEESKRIKEFGQHLGEVSNRAVHFVNETLTSFLAEEILESQGVSVAEAKQRVHQAAAQLILQQYLEENASV